MKLRDIPFEKVNSNLYKWDLSLGLYVSFINNDPNHPNIWICISNIPKLNYTIIEGKTMADKFQKVKSILVENFYFILKY